MHTAIKSNLLNRTEAAFILGIKPQTLAVWKSNKRYNLPCIKVGRSVRYRKEDLEAFVTANVQGGVK